MPLGSATTLQLFLAARSSAFTFLTTNLAIGEWSSRLQEDDLVCTLTANRVATVVRKFNDGRLMVGAAMPDIGQPPEALAKDMLLTLSSSCILDKSGGTSVSQALSLFDR
jgi:hypothetical protein